TTRFAPPPPKKPVVGPPPMRRETTSISRPSSLRGISKYGLSLMRCVLNRPVCVSAADVITRSYGRGSGGAQPRPPPPPPAESCAWPPRGGGAGSSGPPRMIEQADVPNRQARAIATPAELRRPRCILNSGVLCSRIGPAAAQRRAAMTTYLGQTALGGGPLALADSPAGHRPQRVAGRVVPDHLRI